MKRGWTLLVLGSAGQRARTLFVSRAVLALIAVLIAGLIGGAGAWVGWQVRRHQEPRPRVAPHAAPAAAPIAASPSAPRAPARPAVWNGESIFPLRPIPRLPGPRRTGRVTGAGETPTSLPPRPSPFEPTDPLDKVRADAHPTGLKVVIVGIDGATPRIVQSLLDQQELPSLRKVASHGATGILKSTKPMRSPALWTSMVTGRTRGEHGIIGFLNADDPHGQLVSVRDRKTVALWNILTAFGLESGTVGWWVTWPAETVRGYVVSDRFVRSRWTEWKGGRPVAGRTFPEGLAEELEPFVVNPSAPPMDEIDRLVSFTPRERHQFLAAVRPILAHGPSVFKFAHCAQRSYEEIAAHLLQTRAQPDLFSVLLGANDAVSHTFWHDYEPRRFPWGIDSEESRRLGQLIPNYYRHNDAVLGRLAALLGPETVLFVVSDHGFRASGHLPEVRTAALPAEEEVSVGQTGVHHEDGILVVSGGPILPGVRVTASIYDIAPTVLALLGLPVAATMPGRVLEEAVDPEFFREHPVRRVDSYDRLLPRAHGGADLVEGPDTQLQEQLRALGYIGQEGQQRPSESGHAP